MELPVQEHDAVGSGSRHHGGLRAGCPMATFLEMLARPWTLHILWLLSSNGPMRFGSLRRSAEGISARILTVRLRTLEQEGFLVRTVRHGKIPEVTYTPTARLADMDTLMGQLHTLGQKWQQELALQRNASLERATEEPGAATPLR